MKRHLLLLMALLTACSGCGEESRETAGPRPRIVGLAPALTRMTFDMGLGDHIVGISGFTKLPDGEERPVVGDYMDVRIEPLLAVDPEIVLTQSDISQFETFQKAAPEVRIEHFEIETLADIAAAMERIGRITGNEEIGLAAGREFQEKLDAIRRRHSGRRHSGRRHSEGHRPKVLFVIGYEQPLGCGSETFIDEMITLVGGENVLAGEFEGWKNTGLEAVLGTRPDIVVCQCQAGCEEETVRYWSDLGEGRFATRVFAVTDSDWTIPAGHLADYAERLDRMVHAGGPREDASP